MKGVLHLIEQDLGSVMFHLDYPADGWLDTHKEVDALLTALERSRARHQAFKHFLRAQGIE